MQSLDMVTINERLRSEEDLAEMMWKAFDYFPSGLWKGVNYIGNVIVKHDLRIKSKEEVYGTFIFTSLIKRIREMKNALKAEDLLLGVTHDPVIVTHHRFELDGFKRVINLVHDYVSNDVGVISLFRTDRDTATKIAAHGLGHNQGLKHHENPIDLMYVGLLDGSLIEIDGFCDECQRKFKSKVDI